MSLAELFGGKVSQMGIYDKVIFIKCPSGDTSTGHYMDYLWTLLAPEHYV